MFDNKFMETNWPQTKISERNICKFCDSTYLSL